MRILRPASLVSIAVQVIAQPPAGYDVDNTNTCLRRSVYVYTADSSTYVVTNLGSTSLPATPTFCANQTITAAGLTTTITASQPASTGPSAKVAKGAPVPPSGAVDYLLITFDRPDTGTQHARRQSFAAVPANYNVTQYFSATQGTSYALSAYAAEAENGDTKPDCTLMICGDGECGPATPLTTDYALYNYQWTAGADEGAATASYNIVCTQSAYVGLYDIMMVANVSSVASTSSGSALATNTLLQYVTLQQTQTLTQNGTGGVLHLTATETKLVNNAATKVYNITDTVSTVIWSTETELVTVSAPSTTTTTLTRTLNVTATNRQPSLIYETATATSTALLTTTEPGSIQLASTQVLTSVVYSTILQTSYVNITLPQATRSISYTLPQATYTPPAMTTYLTTTLPQSTTIRYISVTLPVVTQNVSVTLAQATTTADFTATLPQQTLTEVMTSTLPQATETITSTLAASMLTRTETESLTRTLNLTRSLPQGTMTEHLTATLTAITFTRDQTKTDDLTRTLNITATLPRETASLTQTMNITRTLPQVTTTAVHTSRSNVTVTPTYSPAASVPEPPMYLATPTAIVGDPVNGAPQDFDDQVFTVSLPFDLSLYAHSSSNVWLSVNGVIGITENKRNSNRWTNEPLPWFGETSCEAENFCFADTAALPFWDDLYIYAGTKQGIYYEVVGDVSPEREIVFEYLTSHFVNPAQYYHFLITFFESNPGVVQFEYLDVSDNGCSATVGVETQSPRMVTRRPRDAPLSPPPSVNSSNYLQYSYNSPQIFPGLNMELNTRARNISIISYGNVNHPTPNVTCASENDAYGGVPQGGGVGRLPGRKKKVKGANGVIPEQHVQPAGGEHKGAKRFPRGGEQ